MVDAVSLDLNAVAHPCIASGGDFFCPVEQQDGTTGYVTGWDGCITGQYNPFGCATGWRPVVYRDSYRYVGWTSGCPVV